MVHGPSTLNRTEAAAYLPGPAPHLAAPDITRAAEAENTLRHARTINAQRGGRVTGITREQAETLLEWITYTTRQALTCPSLLRNNGTDHFSPEHLEGLCGEAATMVGFQAQQMGIRTCHHQLRQFTHGQYYGHAFSVLTLPVMENDTVSAVPYLVDTTFRQFFSDKRKGSNLSEWGISLATTEEGRALADSLLTRGYVALTPEVAQRYISTSDIDRHLHTPTTHRYPGLMTGLLSGSTTISGVGKKTARHDLRSPSLVLASAPLDSAIQAYRTNMPASEAAWWHIAGEQIIDPYSRPVLQEDALRMHDPDTHADYVAALTRMHAPRPMVTQVGHEGPLQPPPSRTHGAPR